MQGKILVTGAAGFIGSSVVNALLLEGKQVIGIDNLNNYYDINLKKERLKKTAEIAKNLPSKNWNFYKQDINKKKSFWKIFHKYLPETVINLAAQAGVRYSLENPSSYFQTNLIGFSNVLELCREFEIKNLIYASSSSVYGSNKKVPFQEKDCVNHPKSIYASTKICNELMAHSYSHLYKLPATGLRFFTVYGPWGRPDMAPFIFMKAILNKQPINLFNYGNMSRDFTYIDDITRAIISCSEKPATPDYSLNEYDPNPSISMDPHRIFNIGNNNPIKLEDFVECIEKVTGIKAIRNFVEMQPGDVETTYADINLLESWIGYKPKIRLEEGLRNFFNWFKDFYY